MRYTVPQEVVGFGRLDAREADVEEPPRLIRLPAVRILTPGSLPTRFAETRLADRAGGSHGARDRIGVCSRPGVAIGAGRALLRAGLRDRGPRRAGEAVRRRAGRADPSCSRQATFAARRSSTCTVDRQRRRAGAPLGGVRPGLREERTASTSTTRTRAATRTSSSTARTERARSRRRRRSCSSSRTSPRTTTAASCSSAPTAFSTGGNGDGGGGGDPQHNGQNLEPALREDHAPERERREAALAARRLRPAQPVALLVRPRKRRSLHRRRRSGRVGGDRLPPAAAPASSTSAGTATKAGTSTSPDEAADATARITRPVAEYSHSDRAAPSPAATSTAARRLPAAAGRYFYGDYCSGTVWSLEDLGRQGDRRAARAVHGQGAVVVRRGLGGRAVSDVRRLGRPATARAVARAGLALVVALVLVSAPALARPHAPSGMDWDRFGYDAARHNSAPGSGITASNAAKLVRKRVMLDGTVDSSPIYLHDVQRARQDARRLRS